MREHQTGNDEQTQEELRIQNRAQALKIISIVFTAIGLPYYATGAVFAGAAADHSSALGAMAVISVLAVVTAIVSVIISLSKYSASKYEKSIKASIICLTSLAMPIIILIFMTLLDF